MSAIFLIIMLLYFAMIVYFAMKDDWKMLIFFMVAVMFQNIIVILFSNRVPSAFITIFSLAKEAMLYLSVLVFVVKKWSMKRNKMISVLVAIWILLMVKNLFLTAAPFSAAVISFRQCIIPFLGILVGKTVAVNKKSVSKLMRFQVKYAIELGIMGVIELVALGDRFWTWVGFADYMYVKQGTLPSQLFRGVTRNFYTWDYFGIPIRRLVSITADPLATAHLIFLGVAILATGCIAVYHVRVKGKIKLNQYMIAFLFLGICSILALSKAVYVLIAVLIVAVLFYRNLFPKPIIKYGAIFAGVVGLIYIAKKITEMTYVTATFNHFSGLINGFRSSSLFGTGLGTAGVMTSQLANSSITTTESFIGTYVQQIGFVGFGILIFVFYDIFKDLVKQWRKYKSGFTLMAIAISMGLLVEMFFSESSVSIMGTCIYFIYIAMATREECYIEMENA